MSLESIAKYIHPELHNKPGLSTFNRVYLFITVFACFFVIAETEISYQYGHIFWVQYTEIFIAVLFLIEFLIRFGTCHYLTTSKGSMSRLAY
ncbi:MAG: hypothetical protein V2I33_04530, partial [Kangiellaceae bacterium]|nr:hypothetical protein [Kangiellaceae bacterium]